MRSKSRTVFIVIASADIMAASAPPTASSAKTYLIRLTGQAEVAAPGDGPVGDKDGYGEVKLVIDSARKKVCYDFALSNLATPLMAHIHKAPTPQNGPSVVTLFTGPGGELHDCVMWTEKRLAEIEDNPSNFYVNVYTTEYPDGALRGELAG